MVNVIMYIRIIKSFYFTILFLLRFLAKGRYSQLMHLSPLMGQWPASHAGYRLIIYLVLRFHLFKTPVSLVTILHIPLTYIKWIYLILYLYIYIYVLFFYVISYKTTISSSSFKYFYLSMYKLDSSCSFDWNIQLKFTQKRTGLAHANVFNSTVQQKRPFFLVA